MRRNHSALFLAALGAGCATTDASDLIADAPETLTPAAGLEVDDVALTAPAAPPEAPITKLIGSYEWVGGKPEQQVVWREIEGIASSFNLFARGIVRSKLPRELAYDLTYKRMPAAE